MRTLTLEEFNDAIFEQTGGDFKKVVFVCPACKTPQGFQDFIDAGVGITPLEVKDQVGTECYGRHTGAGGARKKPDGKPCDWALWGFLQIHDLEVVVPNGMTYPHFEFASAAQYKAYHEARAAKGKAD